MSVGRSISLGGLFMITEIVSSRKIKTSCPIKNSEVEHLHFLLMITVITIELRDAFNIFDRDKSGSISASELKQVLIALNFKATDGLIRKLMKEMDTDGMCYWYSSFWRDADNSF